MTHESRRRPPHPSPAEARPPPSPPAMPVCTRLTPVLNFTENCLILWAYLLQHFLGNAVC